MPSESMFVKGTAVRILAFGDSYIYGAWDVAGGWVERLKVQSHQMTLDSRGATKIQVLNLGIGGDTSRRLLARMESEIQSRESSTWQFALIIGVGTNDSSTKVGNIEVSMDEFTSNIEQIIAIGKKYTDKILFVGLPPLGQSELSFKGRIYSDASVKSYDTALERIVTGLAATYIPIRPAFESAETKDLYAFDSLHPNDKGHEMILHSVRSYMADFGLQ